MSSSTATVNNSTITNNTVTNGAGGYFSFAGTVTVRSSIIAANGNNMTTPDIGRTSGSFTSQGYNLIGNVGASTGFTGPGDLTGTGANPLDPQLGPLTDNGGTTLTHKPASFFPGHDKGCAFGADTDQRGYARTMDWPNVANGMCTGSEGVVGIATDIGAVELLVATAAPASISGRAVEPNGRGIANVIVEVADADGNVLRQTRTNTFGYFVLFDVPAGSNYIVSASAKRYRFAQPSYVIGLQDNLEGVVFVGRGSISQ
jgi:hypothetical protein